MTTVSKRRRITSSSNYRITSTPAYRIDQNSDVAAEGTVTSAGAVLAGKIYNRIVDGVLSFAGIVTDIIAYVRALTGTLTMAGGISAVLGVTIDKIRIRLSEVWPISMNKWLVNKLKPYKGRNYE